jgi:hypothetical protein
VLDARCCCCFSPSLPWLLALLSFTNGIAGEAGSGSFGMLGATGDTRAEGGSLGGQEMGFDRG